MIRNTRAKALKTPPPKAPAAKPPAKRGRPRSLETEAAILDAAYRLAASIGLNATTVDAIARESQVSKMTIYKWWPSRDALLIDAFLRQAAVMVPLPEQGDPLTILRDHAAAYARALNQDFGKVQLAVIAEDMAKNGSGVLFRDRYLKARKGIGVKVIQRGQSQGKFRRSVPASELYDRIYGTLFYQFLFGLRRVTPAHARALVDSVLLPD
ncbi:MAG: TetR/AcrR family transcriptional regulator [Ferrovibrio sp.]|uniref:TetR/AcrR family transcriptional regulator n=1 Tax=Ferrovibrio sp. TaxID=1917215 RepID=UPI0026115110|nr:TetR/AcrR family transcriptional regulator [Ferrovibrio sp.]MCW0233002.1 TetR/AcrR family transcriptional regulator [Ferrovibrio sp.]